MLQQWRCLQEPQSQPSRSATQTPASSDPSSKPSLQETPEQREFRLRKLYETALQTYQFTNPTNAKPLFQNISTQLTSSASDTTSNKRPRPQPSVPLWERNLRYAVHRNLAEVHANLSEHLDAAQMYAKALSIDRSDFLVWLRAARSATRCGHLHIARRAYETALHMRPAHWLCRDGYSAILAAIGDADEDCTPLSHEREASLQSISEILSDQHRHVLQLREKRITNQSHLPETLQLTELTWAALIDVLRLCLERRMLPSQPSKLSIAHPVHIQLPSNLVLTPQRNPPNQVVQILDNSPSRSASPEVSAVPIVHIIDTPNQTPDDSTEICPPANEVIELPQEQSESHPIKNSTSISAKQVGTAGHAKLSDKTDDHSNNVNTNTVLSQEKLVMQAPPFSTERECERRDTGSQTQQLTSEVASAPNNSKTIAPPEDHADKSKNGNLFQKQAQSKLTPDPGTHSVPPVPFSTTEKVDDMMPDAGEVGQDQSPGSRSQVKKESSSANRPEIRRSTRQRTQAEQQSKHGGGFNMENGLGSFDNAPEDVSLIQAFLDICLEKQDLQQKDKKLFEQPSRDPDDGSPSDASDKTNVKLEAERQCSWVKFVSEREEAMEVEKCVKSFAGANSGPIDLLQRILAVLSTMKVTQYSSELALLWSTLRSKLQLHMPGPPSTTALIIEAMLVSGKKAGKAKARRFQEASRLLSHVELPSSGSESDIFLRMRFAWLWGLLYECKGQMQLSFRYSEYTLELLRQVADNCTSIVPDIVGPDLSGYTGEGLEELIQNRISSLKRARDLEKAIEELSKAGKGDEEAAIRTVSILSSSIHSSVKSLELTRWQANELKVEFADAQELEAWEKRLDSEIELEPRLKVFGEACAKSSDSIGDLVCFSLRLRMAVHYYIAKLRSEIEKDLGDGKDEDSSSSRLADLLVQVRKYVALIKKVSSSSSSSLWDCKVGSSGWSMYDAVSIASITLVSLTGLIMTKIPLLKSMSSNMEMGASQKNRRLAFTRCMLAFARCIMIKQKCQEKSTDLEALSRNSPDQTVAQKMLHVICLCLKALVTRGCCREEGTSGALIKLYVRYLLQRLEELAISSEKRKKEAIRAKSDVLSLKALMNPIQNDENGSEDLPVENNEPSIVESPSDSSDDGSTISKTDPEYNWQDAHMIRHELAQCYQCLYQIPELETLSGDANVVTDVPWLEEGCRVSKHIGLSFTTGDPVTSVPTIDADICRDVYFFYRKRIFEAMCLRRREGKRTKRLREVLSRLAGALPEDPPHGVRMLSFQGLDTIVCEVVDSRTDISREAAENVSKLIEEWNREETQEPEEEEENNISKTQFSILYFEVFALHSMSILAAHEAEYKKHKTAERRKRPKEVAERLLAASSECLVALRSRPWSAGTWILLGRIFVEIADLALDEREVNFSTFGLYRSEDLSTLTDGETVETIFGRSEACFGFAESLLRHHWARNACKVAAAMNVADVLGYSYDGNDKESWSGFGDDGDLFGSFGLTNCTTSRPKLQGEMHPGDDEGRQDSRRLMAIRFGSASLALLRLREMRYFYLHWTQSALDFKLLTHPVNRYPESFISLASGALNQLREGKRLLFGENYAISRRVQTFDDPTHNQSIHDIIEISPQEIIPSWRAGYSGVEKLQWHYTFLEAKLMRKVGRPAEEYLNCFYTAIQENKSLRHSLKQPADIEPVYKLHASRLKILRTVEDNGSAALVLALLEKYSFREQGPIIVDDFNDRNKDVDEWITERKISIAEDILSAMQFCRDSKSEVPYSEFHFKSTFCIALILAEVLKDIKGALAELAKLFRLDAVLKALDQGSESSHRGYFYKIWNYRITDTGIEPALETERKLFRWRTKLLGLYGQLLSQTGEWRLLAAIIARLKKRSAEDLPVDGALMDDLISAYAVTRRAAILNSMEKGIVIDVAAFQSSYRRTWDVYIETLRLAQGIKRVRVSLSRGEKFESGSERLIESGRPRCLMAIHTALRLEYLRWRSASGAISIDMAALKNLPVEGSIRTLPASIRADFVETLESSADKWALDDKMTKLLKRRVADYGSE